MRISVCVGEYAASPYCVPNLEINVYSMEELCYCIRENAYLLDISLMNDKLTEWIEKQCQLRELARELYQQVHKSGSLSTFVSMILQYTGFYEEKTIREIEQVLKAGAGLSLVEKRKSQIDYLVKKKHYLSALKGYDQLLENWGELWKEDGQQPAPTVRADILHNKGVAYAGLMQYEQASDCFLKAYQLQEKEEDYLSFLAAERMRLPENDYVAMAAEHPEKYDYALKMEQQVEQLGSQWEQQPEYLRLQHRRELRGSNRQKYLEENEKLIQALKSSYRKSMEE